MSAMSLAMTSVSFGVSARVGDARVANPRLSAVANNCVVLRTDDLPVCAGSNRRSWPAAVAMRPSVGRLVRPTMAGNGGRLQRTEPVPVGAATAPAILDSATRRTQIDARAADTSPAFQQPETEGAMTSSQKSATRNFSRRRVLGQGMGLSFASLVGLALHSRPAAAEGLTFGKPRA